MMSFLHTPSPDINYRLLSLVYAVLSLIAIILYVVEFYLASALDISSDIAGFYIIFAVFIPCYMWSLLMVRRSALLLKARKDD